MKPINSWVQYAPDSDFSIYNIPFGIFKQDLKSPKVSSRIGDFVVDISACLSLGYLDGLGITQDVLHNQYLNDFIALGKPITNKVRMRIQEILTEGHNAVNKASEFLIPIDQVEMLLPVRIGDYTDFYSSREHAFNVGCLFRDPENALLPNWLHLPVGYHGRSSSIVVSGTDIIRPHGQSKPGEDGIPGFGPSRLLDFELEMGFVVGKSTEMGEQISVEDADEHIFGLALFNDWSARDIQGWEYVPLGPFLGKNFASTLSPWIVTLEALEPFRVAGPTPEKNLHQYLQIDGKHNYDIDLEVSIITSEGQEKIVCESNMKHLYWSMSQQLAHHTINGCNVNVGDLKASGTISGPERGSFGSMLEITWKGTKPVQMPDGTERKFIADHDTVVLRGFAQKDYIRVGFGEAAGKVLPAISK